MCNFINLLNNATLQDLDTIISYLENTFNLDKDSLSSVSSDKEPTNVEEKVSKENIKEFTIQIVSVPEDKKISLLKFVKNFLEIGLKESKVFIDSLPKILKKTNSKEEAETIRKDIQLIGAEVIII